MIDDTVADAGNHAFDLMCECGHLHTAHRRGYGHCFEDEECGCSRFRLAGESTQSSDEGEECAE
jgi:hypothetical protein